MQAHGLEYGKVSSTELVQAVHDMLSAAGVRMDAEKETLLQATLSLQDQLKESQVALLVEQVCSLRYLYLLSLIHFFSCNIMNFGNFCTMMRAVSYNLHPLCNDSQCETSFTVELLILELGAKMVSILAMPNLDPSFSTKMSRNSNGNISCIQK